MNAQTTSGRRCRCDRRDDGSASHPHTRGRADAATRAVLKATGGDTASSVADGENGATYEVEVSKPDGATVNVRLDESYKVVVIEGDSGSGDH